MQWAGAMVRYGTGANLPQLDAMYEMVTDYSNVQLREHKGIQRFDRKLTVNKNSHR